MSISAMADQAMARKFPPTATQGIGDPPERGATLPVADGRTSAVTDALNALVTYIPTEIITLYVAVVAALHINDHIPLETAWICFWTFLVASPIVSWLVYAAKLKGRNGRIPGKIADWPKWSMAAATIGYAAWAFTLSNTPFEMYSWYSSAISGVVILSVSSLLALVAPLVTSSRSGQ